MKILFIGAGNMGQAIIGGICGKMFAPNEIDIYEINEATRENVKSRFGVGSISDLSLIGQYDFILLALKPQVFGGFVSQNKAVINSNFDCGKTTIITIMAGVSIDKVQSAFGGSSVNVIRVMPNTPALVGESMSVLCGSDGISNDRMASAQQIFDSVGKTAIMAESYLDAVTGLSGSGPAYIYLIIEALTSGGVWAGLPKPIAQQLAVQTVKGTVAMIEKNPDKAIEDLRHAVTSPGGTTIAGLAALERHGVRNAIMEAVKDAADRSAELGKR